MPRHLLLPLLLALPLFFLLGGCSRRENTADSPTPGALRRVSLQTDWFPEPEHGGYYQALARGFYREAGLEVDIRPGGPNAQVIQSVALGRADFGMTNGDDVLVQIARGVPVVILAAEMQREAQGVLFHATHPIRSLRDLAGRRLMAGPGATWLQYARKHYGIDFEIVPLYGDLTRFLADPSFAQQCFVTSEPYYARQRGADAQAILVAGDGYDPYRVIFTSRAFLSADREAARRFAAASVRGWADYMNGDPAPAKALIAARNDKMTPDFIDFSYRALKEYRLIEGDPARGETIGRIDPVRLESQAKLLQELGIVDRVVSFREAVAADCLPVPAAP